MERFLLPCVAILATCTDNTGPSRAQRFLIRFEHEGDCAAYLREGACQGAAHWLARAGERRVASGDELLAELKKEKDAGPLAGADGAAPARGVAITAPPGIPWELVLPVVTECALLGLHDVEWRAVAKDGGGKTLRLWLPKEKTDEEKKVTTLEEVRGIAEIRVFMKRDAGRTTILRKIGNRGEVDSNEDLVRIALAMQADARKWTKRIDIVVDAGRGVPWKDVMELVEAFHKENLKPIAFVRPVPIEWEK